MAVSLLILLFLRYSLRHNCYKIKKKTEVTRYSVCVLCVVLLDITVIRLRKHHKLLWNLKLISSVKRLRKRHYLLWNLKLIPFVIRLGKHHKLLWNLTSIPSVIRLRKHHNLLWNLKLVPFVIRLRKRHNLPWNLTLPSSLQTIPRRRPWRFSCGHACSHGFVGTPAYFFGRSLKRSTVGTPACVPFTTSPRPLFSDSSSFFFFPFFFNSFIL